MLCLDQLSHVAQTAQSLPFLQRIGDCIALQIRLCLALEWAGLDRKPKKILSKSTPTFLLFISHQSHFITIQIKKSLQNKIFYFSIQNILTFSLTSIKFAIVLVHFLKSIPLPNIGFDLCPISHLIAQHLSLSTKC